MLEASGFAPGPSDLPLTEVFVDALAGMGDKQALALGRALRLPRKALSFPKHISALGVLLRMTRDPDRDRSPREHYPSAHERSTT